MIRELPNYVRKFYRLPQDLKKLLLQATWHSLIAECQLKLGHSKAFTTYQDNLPETLVENVQQKHQVLQMRKVMHILEHRAPWTPLCLNRAVVAKRLLRKQGIETTIHVGFKPRKAEEEFEGHAWLTINGFIITGRIPQLKVYKELRPILAANFE